MRIITCTNVSLDGVMQAPARADEDTRGGFAHGGWAAPYGAMVHAGDVFGKATALLFGRRTYEDFYSVWPSRKESPFTPFLTNITKYVVSRTLEEPLPWSNSILLRDIGALRTIDGTLLILGSGELIRSLTRASLIDEYLVLIHPLIIGSGTRLFGEDGFLELRLTGSRTTDNGVIIANYER